MRAFFITTCVLSLIYIVVAFGIASVVQSYEWSSYSSYDTYDSYSSYDPYSYDYDNEADKATQAGGVISVIFMLISAVVFMLALMKIKTKTMKVISIIALSISGIFLLWGFLPMTSPGGVSFDEVGPAFALAGVALLAFNIVGMIHAFKTST